MEKWSIIEADFQREYGINLIAACNDMSWRRFLILLRGLSAESALAMSIQMDKNKPLSGEEANRALKQAFGLGRKKVN